MAWEDAAVDPLFVRADTSIPLLAVAAMGQSTLSEVELVVDDAILATDSDESDGWSFSWSPVAGSGTAQLRVLDSSGRSVQTKARAYEALNAFDYWRYEYWGQGFAADSDSAAAADPDADQITNLWEYAIGSNPQLVGGVPAAAMVQATTFSSPQGEAFGLSHRFRSSDPSLRFTLEEGDLVNPWEVVESPALRVDPDPDSADFGLMFLGRPLADLQVQQRSFLRVTVSLVTD